MSLLNELVKSSHSISIFKASLKRHLIRDAFLNAKHYCMWLSTMKRLKRTGKIPITQLVFAMIKRVAHVSMDHEAAAMNARNCGEKV